MNKRVTFRATAAVVDSPDGLTWFAALPQSRILYGDEVIDFSSDEVFDAVTISIRSQLARFQPQLIREHKRTGTGLGLVCAVSVVTREFLAGHDILIEAPRALMLGVCLNPDGEKAKKTIEYVSVGLGWDVSNETGSETWPYYLSELSAVTEPHIRTDQPPASALRNIQFSVQKPAPGETMPQETKVAPDGVAEVEKELAAEDGTEDGPTVESLTETLAERDAEIAALRAELAELTEAEMSRLADAAVAELGVTDDAERVEWCALYKQNTPAFQMAAARLKAAPRPRADVDKFAKFGARQATPAPAVELSVMDKIEALKATGMTHTQAYIALHTKGDA